MADRTTPGTVVIGGGIAGISAATSLALAGVPALILERNGVSLGGRVAGYPPTSFQHGGKTWTFTVEHGIHGWWRQYRNFLSLVDELGLRARMIDAFDQTVLFSDGQKWFHTNVGRETQITPVPEPLHHAQLIRKKNIRRLIRRHEIPLLFRLGIKILESVQFDPWDPRHLVRYDQMSITDYMQDVPYFYAAFLRSLSRSGFFSDPQHVSLWAYMVALQLYVFLRRSDQKFEFVRGPIMRDLLMPFVDRVEAAGGGQVRGVHVVKVERRSSGGWILHWVPGDSSDSRPAPFDGQGGTMEADDLILAVDVEGGKELLAASPDLQPVLGDLSVFEGRKATTVRLWWARSPDTTWGESGVFTGRATADNYFWLHRFQDEFMAFHAETGGSVGECHLYAPPWKHDLSDLETLDRVRTDMEGAFPELAGSCIHGVVVRNKGTHINFPVGCARSFPKVRTRYPDLHLCGDWIDGGAPVLYMERACQTGLAAANEVRRRKGLPVRDLLVPLPPPVHMQGLQAALRIIDRISPSVWGTKPASERSGDQRYSEEELDRGPE